MLDNLVKQEKVKYKQSNYYKFENAPYKFVVLNTCFFIYILLRNTLSRLYFEKAHRPFSGTT